MRARVLVLGVVLMTAACSSSERDTGASSPPTSEPRQQQPTTTAPPRPEAPEATSTTAASSPPTTTSPGRNAWPTTTKVDEALGVEITITTSSKDIGPDEQATFVFRIRNTSETDHVVYDSNSDFIGLHGGPDRGSWAPVCMARTAAVIFADLAPGASIGGHDVAYPGDTGPEPCPRPSPGDYELVVAVYGCRGPHPHQEGTDACGETSWARASLPVRQR